MISISLPLPPTGLRAPGSPASGAPPGDFALTLADMLAVPAAGVKPTTAAPHRQIDAGSGKALPVDRGIDTIEIEGNMKAPPPDAPVLPHETGSRPDSDATDRSPDKERAHARKEAIAALPLPIPGAVPDAPLASKTVETASASPSSAPRPVRGAAVDSPAAAPPPGQSVTTDATPHAREAASAMSPVAPHVSHAASTTAPIAVDPAATQPGPRRSSVPAGAPVRNDADAPVDQTLAPERIMTARADTAAVRPKRFAARPARKPETVVPAERRPAWNADTRRTPGMPDAHSDKAAPAPLQSAKPGNTAAASTSPGADQRPTPSAAKVVATTPLPAERRAGRLDASRPGPAMTGATHHGSLRPQPSPVERAGIAPADAPRVETNTADRPIRPVPAPDAPRADAARPHRPAIADARISAAPADAPAARNATPSAPDRVADSGSVPAQANPAAPAQRTAPTVPPAAVPIAAMFGGPRPIDPRTLRAGETIDAPSGLTPTVAAAHAASPVRPVADMQRTPLDMRRDDWTRKLIDRIETIRDAAGAADTRIKLMPDALGKIDVSMRKDGDTLHVSFTADVPATRAMLADAQPKLAELAQQRGLRLGQASVDAGTSGDGQQRPADPRPLPARPIRAAARAEAPSETGRVA